MCCLSVDDAGHLVGALSMPDLTGGESDLMLTKARAESSMTAEQRAARVRLMVLDVDGVLTDGRLYYGPQGEAMKVFDVRDGHGIKMLVRHGVEVATPLGAQLRHRFCACTRAGHCARAAGSVGQIERICNIAR